MVTSLELLAKFGPKLPDDEIVETAEKALAGMKRLHGEIEDVLQYVSAPSLARPGEGFSLSQLQPLMAEISANLGLESVTVSGHEGLENGRILLSRQGIELALWEVLDNSKKFHPKEAPTVEVVVSGSSHEISIQISDDGLTLSPEQLAQVWTPYYQGEKDFTGEVTGMGLGLSMVASVVWAVGGTCHLHNRAEGPGIAVELVLPLEKE
jgi:signal transduction histidine kinase